MHIYIGGRCGFPDTTPAYLALSSNSLILVTISYSMKSASSETATTFFIAVANVCGKEINTSAWRGLYPAWDRVNRSRVSHDVACGSAAGILTFLSS